MDEGEVTGTLARPIHTIDSAYAKEMRKHEANYSQFGPPGRPHTFREYPTMMYRAGRLDHGPIGILDAQVAESEAERSNLESLGFVHGGQGEAIKAFEKQQLEYATIAAARNYEDRNMGDKAKVESAWVESTNTEHIPAIPEGTMDRKLRRN